MNYQQLISQVQSSHRQLDTYDLKWAATSNCFS